MKRVSEFVNKRQNHTEMVSASRFKSHCLCAATPVASFSCNGPSPRVIHEGSCALSLQSRGWGQGAGIY